MVHIRCVFDNLGDILVANAIEEMLSGMNVFSAMPSRLLKVFDGTIGVQRAFAYSGLGGGTLVLAPRGIGWLEAVEYFIHKTKPLCTFGTGVIDPEFRAHVSALNRDSFSIDRGTVDAWRSCLSHFRFVTVRGVESERIVKEMGFFPVEVIGDPAIYYSRPNIVPKKCRKRIGVNMSVSSDFWGNSQKLVLERMRTALHWLRQEGWRITIFPTEPRDHRVAQDVCKDDFAEIPICDLHRKPQAFIERVAEQDVFLGTKLHSVISAFCSYTPSIMIGYQPKCYDFMKTMGFERYYMRSDQLEAEWMISCIQEMYENIEGIQKRQFEICQYYRNKQLDFRNRVLKSIGISIPGMTSSLPFGAAKQ